MYININALHYLTVPNQYVELLPCAKIFREATNVNVLKDIVVIRSANVSNALEALVVVNPPTCKLATNANWQDVLQMLIAHRKKPRALKSPEESVTVLAHPDFIRVRIINVRISTNVLVDLDHHVEEELLVPIPKDHFNVHVQLVHLEMRIGK